MSSALEKILNLAKKTGDNVIVFNPAKPSDSYVILALNSYERLVNERSEEDFLTGEGFNDKINPEIQTWSETDDWDENDHEVGYNQGFLPEDIFQGEVGETETGDDYGQAASAETMEDKWEEDVNYLYPTEEELALMAKEESLAGKTNDFNAIADILENKRDKKNNWSIPTERQNLEEEN